MKAIYLLFITVFFATIWTGCKEEDTPPAIVEGLKAYPGKNRAQVEFTTPADIKTCKVFYNNGKFMEQPINGTPQTVIIEGLAEGEQILRVVTLNDAGVASDPKGVKVKVYGSSYQSKLNARKLMEQNTLSENSLEMLFEAAAADETGVWVVFTNTSGSLDSMKMGNANTSIVINNINLNEVYYFYSVYKPEAGSIDEFPSSPVDAKNAAMFNFEKDKWTIAGFSDEEPGSDGKWALASYVIDNNANTDWHSKIVPGVEPMPHWIAVDMGSEKKFNGFYFVQTQNTGENGLARHFTFSISADGENWTTVLNGEFANSRIRQEFAFAQQQIARYFKLTITSGYNDVQWSQFAEIDLYNELNVSGINGSVPIKVLVNTKRPFAVENPNPWNDGRLQQLTGWTHNKSAYVSYDGAIAGGSIAMFGLPGAVDFATNAKVYQTVNLEAGEYIMMFDCGNYDWGSGVLAYGVIASGEALPDITVATSSPTVLGYCELSANASKVNAVPFTLTSPARVSIGWVYNTFSNGYWTAFYMNGVELLQNL